MEIPASFAALLSELLVKHCLTPSRLADIIGIQPNTVRSWLSKSQLPTAASVWAVAKAIGTFQEELFYYAIVSHHRRMIGLFTKELKFDKSISDYLNKGDWWQQLPEKEQQIFMRIWSNILTGQIPLLHQEEPSASDLLILPSPTILVIEEWDKIIKHIAKDSSILYKLDWQRFEDLMAQILERYGWETKPMGYTKDDGVDIVAVRRVAPDFQFRMMVQCKRNAKHRKIGVDVVREVWSVKWEKAFHHAMIVTTSTFTREAKRKGEKWDLALKDHNAITEWCKGIQSSIHKNISFR